LSHSSLPFDTAKHRCFVSFRANLADSALHAPAAGFGDQDLSPDFVDKGAVLVVRLAKTHPLAL
jgi:prophage maintenance system killer protein